jgi:3-oxoadipate enol-lactonase
VDAEVGADSGHGVVGGSEWGHGVVADPHLQRATTTLPPGRTIELPGRGPVFARLVPAPAGRPTLLLLHGWTATADVNWFRAYGELETDHGIVAMDLRGHGRGLRLDQRFTLEACADDAAALLDVLAIPKVIAVGYSMGGAVAQLLWQRHPERVDGLVLCSTAATFNATARERALFTSLTPVAAASRVAPPRVRAAAALRLLTGRPDRSIRQWALGEISRHDWIRIVEAGRAIGRFDSRRWIGGLDLPVAVAVTLHDDIVPLARQLSLAGAIPGATLHEVAGDHGACVNEPRRWLPALCSAVASVHRRAAT